jgi:glycosyltransferase involved in cell wall biosynthesis
MMRIGIDARFYGHSGKGLGRYTEKLIEHLELLDKSNDYFVFLRRENFDAYAPKNPRFKKVLAWYPWYGFSEQFLFPFLLLRYRLDLVHFPHFNIPFWYPRKFVVTIHDLILLHYPTILNTTRSTFFYFIKFAAYRFVIASAIRRARHIITVSHFTKRDILKHYKAARGKISVTYEAADTFCKLLDWKEEWKLFYRLKLFNTQDGNEPEKVERVILKPYILYVGNAYPHKNLEAILRAALSFPDFAFILVGKEDYFYARLKKMARGRKIKNVIFAGFVDDRELNSLYHFAVCYIFPSFYEGFGLPPLEAMARGLPVLSSDQGALSEILGNAARYFNPHIKGSLEKELAEILNSKTVREELISCGYNQAARYNWETMARTTLEIYLSSEKD